MDLGETRNNYKKMSTGELTKLVSDIKTLDPDVITLLQDELIKRGEIKKAIRINDYLISIKHHISDNIIFKAIVKLRKKGFSEVEIDKQLIDKHEIDPNYLQLMKYSLKNRGKGDITYGLSTIITSLILGIVFFTINRFFIMLPVFLMFAGMGAWHLSVGLVKINR